MRDLVVSIARAELGTSDPTRYWVDVLPGQTIYPPHWCGAFVLWCYRQARLTDWTWRIGIGFLSAPDASGVLRWRLPRTNHPLRGDTVYRDRPYQHYSLVDRVEGDRIFTIDGNSGWPAQVREQEHRIGGEHIYSSIESLINDVA